MFWHDCYADEGGGDVGVCWCPQCGVSNTHFDTVNTEHDNDMDIYFHEKCLECGFEWVVRYAPIEWGCKENDEELLSY